MGDPVLPTPDQPHRIRKKPELDAFLLCMLYFLSARRHLLFPPPVNDRDLFSTKPESTSCCVHCHIASTHHGHVLSYLDRGIVLREKIGFHQVHPRQEFV